MNYDKLFEKMEYVNANINKINIIVNKNYSDNFDINFAHNSTAIEGNTLSLIETKMIFWKII